MSTYRCKVCGSDRVELSFPVWIPANNMGDCLGWEVDWEASPEEDSDKCWCNECADHVPVIVSHEDKEEVKA